MNKDLVSYYSDRAKEYDRVYANPNEQPDLHTSTLIFQKLFAGKNVLEIACGTGYWTEKISQTAKSVFATDINQTVVDIANQRQTRNNVSIEVADMYDLPVTGKFDGFFAGFLWSHILLQDIDDLLSRWKQFLSTGATIAFIDSNPVKGTIHDKNKIAATDEYGNSFQSRMLDDGSTHLVLKNFPTEEFLTEKLSGFFSNIQYTKLEYYWVLSCNF